MAANDDRIEWNPRSGSGKRTTVRKAPFVSRRPTTTRRRPAEHAPDPRQWPDDQRSWGDDDADSVKVLIKRYVWANPRARVHEIQRQLPRGTQISNFAVMYIAREFKHSAKVLASLGAIRLPSSW